MILLAVALGWAHLLVSFLIMLLVVFVIGALVVYILSLIPGVPPWSRNVVIAVCALVVLIWLVDNIGALTGSL